MILSAGQIPIKSMSFKLFQNLKILNKQHTMQLPIEPSCFLFFFLNKQLYLNVHFVSVWY